MSDTEHTSYTAAAATAGRVIVGRIMPGSDLLGTLQRVCHDYGITTASVNLAFGTLAHGEMKWLRRSDGAKPSMQPVTVPEPFAFLGGSGLIGQNAQGQLEAHFHGALQDVDGTVHGGHFLLGGNTVYNTTDFVITELLGIDIRREWEEATNTIEMIVTPSPGRAEPVSRSTPGNTGRS